MDRATGRPFRAAIILICVFLLGGVLAAPSAIALKQPGDFLIRNTVRISLLYWALAVVLMTRRDPSARLAWTLACAAYLVHVATAFEHAHHWSHAEAFQHVKKAGGYGEGIFVSYLFTLIWTADVGWWWLAPESRECRARWMEWAMHGFMIFVIVNATVIFESGPIRWISAATFAALAFWLAATRRASGAERGSRH
jgi:hypothetical protein